MELIGYFDHLEVPELSKAIDNIFYMFLYSKYAGWRYLAIFFFDYSFCIIFDIMFFAC